jgi:uncharacterized DUF497 family protein
MVRLPCNQIVYTIKLSVQMPVYDWDETKRALNLADGHLDFTLAENFDWDTAVMTVDDRDDYGELRERALGFIGVRLYILVFTRRRERIRIISLRKANRREMREYEEEVRG